MKRKTELLERLKVLAVLKYAAPPRETKYDAAIADIERQLRAARAPADDYLVDGGAPLPWENFDP